jgi:hypothetical protein
MMFNFTGSEKAVVALGPATIPLTTLVGALLAYWGLGEMPEPVQIRDAIVFFLGTLGFARLVWQVPNSVVEDTKEVEENFPLSE